jgi:hypothetical protein
MVVALGFLQAPAIVVAAEPSTIAEKLPAPPRTPETGIDPGIQVHPGPSPDPHTAVPPKHNPDPGMAINPDVTPGGPPNARRLPPPDPNSGAREPDTQPKKRPDSPKH